MITDLLARILSRRRRRESRTVRAWEAAGRPAPPPSAAKHAILREVARRHGVRVFVETGTFRGGTVAALRGAFSRIYSIELDPALCAQARTRFARVPHVTVLEGDSADVLPRLLPRLEEPCLFWLDGHYSGGVTARGTRATPVMEELRAILAHPVVGHVIVVDDAREFGTALGYPPLDAVRALFRSRDPRWVLEVRDDLIRIHR